MGLSKAISVSELACDLVRDISASHETSLPVSSPYFGDFFTDNPTRIVYTETIDRKDLPEDSVFTSVGFNYRDLPEAKEMDRCSMNNVYPVGYGFYQKFDAPGTSAGPVEEIISKDKLDQFMKLCEEFEEQVYRHRLGDFRYKTHMSQFDHDTLKKFYLRWVMVVMYQE